jgi:hypothetical protein
MCCHHFLRPTPARLEIESAGALRLTEAHLLDLVLHRGRSGVR